MLPSSSTLKLQANLALPNYINPWSIGGTNTPSATVTAVSYDGEKYLITNAHAVMDEKYLKVKLDENSRELAVKSVWVDPTLDLAILKATSQDVADFLNEKMQATELVTDFQKQGTKVYAYGYPVGGQNRTVTEGNISRYGISTIALSKENAIMVQTSAAINAGNSGGPITCMIDGVEKCIGIVAQGISSLQNTGYFIPASTVVETINRYKKYRGVKERGFIDFITAPCCYFNWQQLKNPILRTELGLPDVAIDQSLTGF